MKKFVALALTFVMLFTFLPWQVLAEDESAMTEDGFITEALDPEKKEETYLILEDEKKDSIVLENQPLNQEDSTGLDIGQAVVPPALKEPASNINEVDTVEVFKQAVKNAKDGDVILIKDLKNPKDFQGEEIVIDKNLTIKAELEYETEQTMYKPIKTNIQVREIAILKNLSFDIAKGKTLTLSTVKIYGNEGVVPIHGDGNLIVSNLSGIFAAKGMAAVNLPAGIVEVKGIESIKNERTDYNDIIEKVKASGVTDFGRLYVNRKNIEDVNRIVGGEGDTKAGEAIIAKNFVMTDTNNQGFQIIGGNSKEGQGAFAILADNVKIDIRQAQSTLPNLLIKGGDGRYPGGSIRGMNLDIVAGGSPNSMNGIRPGAGTRPNPGIEPGSDHYVGVVEVKDGGKLDFGKGIEESKQSHLAGFDQSYFYGPTILAKGDAQVNIHGGTVTGALVNPKQDQYHLAPRAVIEMGTGKLNVTSTNVEAVVEGGYATHGNLEAMILSQGDVLLSGDKVSVRGPGFPSIPKSAGYATANGPKRGAAGVKTTGDVTITKGANVKGGTINNLLIEDDALKNQYRTGSGIVGANKVTVSNGAIVQGDGLFNYKKGALEEDYKYRALNLSSGYGVEDVKELVIDDGFVHGGDLNYTSGQCNPKNVCSGHGTAGSGIKNVPKVEIKGDSLVTGGSPVGNYTRNYLFFGKLEAGHGIDNSEIQNDVVNISGSAKIYGGNSGLKGGHGIVGSEKIAVADDAHISGGACRELVDGAPAGSGIYNATDVSVTGGTVEAGNHAFQNDYDYMKNMMHPRTKDKNYPGDSSNAVAIHAKGLVLVDGKDKQPVLKSHFSDYIALSAPAVKLEGDNGTFILGKGKVEAATPLSNLVEGGRYHVDIFKDNEVNTVKLVDEANDSQGLCYKDASTPLYRVFYKDGDKYMDASIDGTKPIEVAGYKLYAKDSPMKLSFLSYGRKMEGQKTAYDFIEEKDPSKRSIKHMLADNLLIKKPAKPNPGEKPVKPNPGEKSTKPIGIYFTLGPSKLNTEDHFAYLFGYPDQTFGPDKLMTRGEVAAMFVRLMERAPEAGNPSFTDVNKDTWCYTYVAKAEAAGILKGYEDHTFRPNNPISRAEFAAIAMRFDQLKPATMPFTDVGENHWAHDAIASAYAKGWISGYPDKTFRPEENIKRSEVATMTNQVLNRYADKAWVQEHKNLIVHFIDIGQDHWAYYPIVEATNGHDYTRKSDGKNENWIQLNNYQRR
ncbi:hypothetical protein HMPREF9130_1832 [Peptoniphilus sp. oral taxon 375 str. F0436]|nr:hypothetical protein HMPREF9130_1832 [Peptoniphilus sp. oral taxon 375 str. F0436]